MLDPEAFSHFVVKKTFTGTVGLDPFAVDDELGNGAFAGAFNDFVGGTGGGLDVDFFVGNIVLGEKAPGFAAVGAPEGGVEDEFHDLVWGTQLATSYTRSSCATVRSFTRLPVFRVPAGSNRRSQHSSSATGRCSTPCGTTMNSPSSIHSWWSRNSIRKRPLTTRNNSSSWSW